MHLLIYTYPTCSHCDRARELLVNADIDFDERSLEGDRELGARLRGIFGRAVMPYIMLDGEPLGGIGELEQALAEGELG